MNLNDEPDPTAPWEDLAYSLTPDEIGALSDLERDELDALVNDYTEFDPEREGQDRYLRDLDHLDSTACGACGGWHDFGKRCELDPIFAVGQYEGWGLFESSGSSNGPWQIQKVDFPENDDDPVWTEDVHVWEWLYFRAIHGDDTLARLMAFLATENPQEYHAIVRWCVGPRKDRYDN